jgi:MFS family permease
LERSNGDSSRIDGKAGWIVVAAITTILTFTSGARLLPGIVLKPVTAEFGWSRSELMLAISINMIVLSILQPFLGLATDRFGARSVLVSGTALLGLMLLPLSQATELWQFYVLYGVVGAFALAAVSPVNVTAIVSGWFEKRRGAALSISTSGSAFGQLMIVPAGTWLLTSTTWPNLYLMLALVLLVVMTPLSFFLVKSNRTATAGGHARHIPREDDEREPLKLGDALAGSSFWLLAFGFFVCGFTMAFASAHFMAYADDMGMAVTRAADIVAVTAIFSIGGSFLLGMAADRYDRRYVLALTYALRGGAFVLLWLLPVGPLLFIYALVLGVSWTATTPLTAAISADLYGRKNLGLIFGMMFSFMNVGFGAGSFLDGLVYDTFGSYRAALLANSAMGILAAVAVLRAGKEVRPMRAVASTPSTATPDFGGMMIPGAANTRAGD